MKKKELFKKYARGGARFAFAFALARSPARCGVFPFGLALCCGVRGDEMTAFLGVFAASLTGGEPGYVRAAAAMIIFGVRYLFGRRGRQTSPAGAGALALAATAATAAYEALHASMLFDSAFRAGCTLALLPLFAVMISLHTPFSGSSGRRASKLQRQISLLAWAFCAVRAFAAADVGTVMPSLAAGFFCALCAGRESPFFGGMCGFAAGLAAGPVYIPVMCIAGMAYGVFRPDTKWFALVFSTLLSLTSGVYLATFEGAFPEFFNLLAGAAAFGILQDRVPAPRRQTAPVGGSGSAELKKMSAAFAAISEAFYTQPAPPACRADLCAAVKAELFSRCEKCRRYVSCRIDKYDYVNHLTELASCGEALPPHIGEQCPHAAQLAKTSLAVCARMSAEAAARSGEKAESYMSFARLLCSAGERAETRSVRDDSSAAALKSALEKHGMTCGSVRVTGDRSPQIKICGACIEKCGVTPDDLRRIAARTLNVRVSAPEIAKTETGWDITLRALPRIRIEYGKACSSKTGESVSGDTAVAFESDDCVFYSLLADGMGSGADAACASRLAALFMEKLILAGGDKKEALAMLNRMLLTRRDEVFTTVDLLEVDRVSGEACIIKAGAAPSFLFRAGKCWKIATDTPPAGVLGGMKVTQTSLGFRRGDVLVMLSDGACPEHGVPPVPQVKNTASAYASQILESRRGGIDADDMSVCVIKAV